MFIFILVNKESSKHDTNIKLLLIVIAELYLLIFAVVLDVLFGGIPEYIFLDDVIIIDKL